MALQSFGERQGLAASAIPTPLVEGDNRPGLAFAIAQAIAGAQVNMTFFVAQAIGRKFTAVLGFETEADAKTAAPLIKKAVATKKSQQETGERTA